MYTYEMVKAEVEKRGGEYTETEEEGRTVCHAHFENGEPGRQNIGNSFVTGRPDSDRLAHAARTGIVLCVQELFVEVEVDVVTAD